MASGVITVKIDEMEMVKSRQQLSDMLNEKIPIDMIGIDVKLERNPAELGFVAHVKVERKMDGDQYLLF